MKRKNVIIIGGGPAALMLALELDPDRYRVTLCEKKKTVGRKFLVAGEGGLNLTYNSSVEDLVNQYTPPEFMAPAISRFTNTDLMEWLGGHGIATFVGSSKRVFPDPALKPIEVLNKIVASMLQKKVAFRPETEWVGWDESGELCFAGGEMMTADIVVFAMGGASWKVTGSDGAWRQAFESRGIKVRPFRAANCAFGVDWNRQFVTAHEGKPLKNIALRYRGIVSRGELVVTGFGLEGNAIYPLSEKFQQALQNGESTVAHLDLKPTMTSAQLRDKYHRSRLTNVTDILKKDLNLDRTSLALLKQFTDRETFLNPGLLVESIKSVPILIESAADLEEAISTLGGVALEEIDENFRLKKIPDSYAIGEMLDWYAPTGGYLLQGCFSMGFALAGYLNGVGE